MHMQMQRHSTLTHWLTHVRREEEAEGAGGEGPPEKRAAPDDEYARFMEEMGGLV
jgi:hypothetical protein